MLIVYSLCLCSEEKKRLNGIAHAMPFLFVEGLMGDILQKAANLYSQICKQQYYYILSNDEQFCIAFKPQNFVHLAGLRKLKDLNEFQECYSANNIFKRILRGEITELILQESAFYTNDIKERIEGLCRLEDVLQSEQVVWNFDANKAPLRTKLKSKVFLYLAEDRDFYLMLGTANDGKTYYPETFFYRWGDEYIRGQCVVTVVNMEKKRA